MANSYFQFKQFKVRQDQCAMKVTTDSCLFGAWVAAAIEEGGLPSNRILDIGTGTGLLSLMLAQKAPAALIDAVEIDPAACAQAEENTRQSPFAARIVICPGDVLEGAASAGYDIVISNPPFYENELKSADMQKNIAHHGQRLGLDRLIAEIRKRLRPDGGRFFLLLPYKRKNETLDMARDEGLFVTRMAAIRQSTGHGYFRLLIGGSNAPLEEMIQEEIAIRDERNEYTTAFTQLLREYYLYL